MISTIGAIYADGCVYPRPPELNARSSPASGEQTLPEQNQSVVRTAAEGVASQANMPPLMPNQPAATNMNFLNQNLSIPISSPQQMLMTNHYPQGQANLLQHYSMQQQQQHQQRASPQGQRLPGYYNNGRNLTPQQQQMLMNQRGGLGNCHQQVQWQ